MSLVADYSVARPDPAALKAAGYADVMRYLAPVNPQTQPKLLTAPERDALHAAGVGIGLVFEWTAARAAAGAQAGKDDVSVAEEQAHTLGYPSTFPIFYAVDFGAGVSTVQPYFEGIASAATNPVGVYGDQTVIEGILDAGTATVAWQTCAWSGTSVSPRASLYQRLHATVANPIAGTDENVLLHPVSFWTGDSAPAHVPVASPIPVVFQAPPTTLPDLKLGMRGAAIRALQAGLDHVFPSYAHLATDGIFGPATFAAVQEFQKRSQLTPDGVVGPITRAHLRVYGIIV